MLNQSKSQMGAWLSAGSSPGIGLSIGIIALTGGAILALGGPIAALAMLVAMGAAALVLREIEYGFWAIIGVVSLLPFATIPVDIGLTPTLLDMALGATTGVWALRVVTVRRRVPITSVITMPIILFLLAAVFSFVFGLANGPLTPNLLRHFAEMLVSIAFVLIVIDYHSSWGRLERTIRIILLSGTGAAIIAIMLWLLNDDLTNTLLNSLQRIGYPGGFVIRYIEDNPENAERAIGTSVDPNALGGFILMISTLVAPQVVARRPVLPRWLAGVAFGALFICLVLTFSRGAMVGLIAGLGLIVLVRYRRLIPYLALAGTLLLLLPITQTYLGRFVEGFQGQDLATQMRFGEYRDALTLIGRYPVFGVGFAGSPDIDLYLGVANVYLTIGQQMGIFGLASFAVIIGTLFGYALLNRGGFQGDGAAAPIWLGLHAAILGGLVAGIFDHYLFNIDFHHAVTAFWLLLGLAVSATRLGGGIDPRQAVGRAAPSST